MGNHLKSNFFTYLYGGAIALAASLVLSGCRIGNYTQGGGPINVFYYETAPVLAQICVNNGTCAPTSTSSPIFDQFAAVFTDPFEVYLPDPSQTQAIFVAPGALGTANAQEIGGTQSGGALSAAVTQDATQVFSWQDANSTCTQSLAFNMNGNTFQGPLTTNTGVTVNSRVHMVIVLETVFAGNCTSLFQTAANCYSDVTPFTQCDGTSASDNAQRHTAVTNVFGDYVDAGILKVTDIPNVQDLYYTITYN